MKIGFPKGKIDPKEVSKIDKGHWCPKGMRGPGRWCPKS